MVWPIDDVVTMGEQFQDVVATDPVSAVLVVIGASLVAAASGVFGYLTLGALVDLLTPDRIGRAPPR